MTHPRINSYDDQKFLTFTFTIDLFPSREKTKNSDYYTLLNQMHVPLMLHHIDEKSIFFYACPIICNHSMYCEQDSYGYAGSIAVIPLVTTQAWFIRLIQMFYPSMLA